MLKKEKRSLLPQWKNVHVTAGKQRVTTEYVNFKKSLT